jgi:glycosyltransferase involved in cell wall biosynthesis
MRIGFEAKKVFTNYTGLGNYARNLLSGIAQYYPENEYHLYMPSAKRNKETSLFLDNATFHIHTSNAAIKAYWRSFSICSQLKKDKIELFHGLSHELPLNIYSSGIKSIVTCHDLISLLFPEWYPALDRMMYNFKFKSSCKNADTIIAISENTKNDIIKYYNIDPQKIQVVYPSFDNVFAQIKDSSSNEIIFKQLSLPKEYLLYVGSVTERKNLLSIIKAIEMLSSENRLPLVVVGNGRSYKKKVQEYISEKKLDLKIIWLENISENGVLRIIYQQARIFIYPSLYEGFGMPVMEAMLCKTPVITSNTSALPEAGGPDSYYIDPNNAEQIAEGIEKILTNESLRNTMIVKGFDYVQKFSGKKTASDTISVYQKTLML